MCWIIKFSNLLMRIIIYQMLMNVVKEHTLAIQPRRIVWMLLEVIVVSARQLVLMGINWVATSVKVLSYLSFTGRLKCLFCLCLFLSFKKIRIIYFYSIVDNFIIWLYLIADVDECDELLDDCDPRTHYCVNTPGSYQCQTKNARPVNCGIGYIYDVTRQTCRGKHLFYFGNMYIVQSHKKNTSVVICELFTIKSLQIYYYYTLCNFNWLFKDIRPPHLSLRCHSTTRRELLVRFPPLL